ncbi:MAG TPA: DoxX family membrane protein [Cyclobacteriaceae bacterium]|nr:DoxX family membrane protein [Cyclobacteriaceae bacterium]
MKVISNYITSQYIKLFLRLALSFSFLSAVADRFGWWPAQISVWGNWENFVAYTQVINPWLPEALVSPAAMVATAAEVIFPVCLLVGFKTELVAKLSGILLLIFALAMAFSTGIKGAFDYSVFTASAAAFALSTMKEKFLEVDRLLVK